MNLQSGSAPWLIQHELRLYWRGLGNKFSGKVAIIILLILLHLVAIPIALALKHMPSMPQRGVALLFTIGGSFVLLLMISRSLITTVQALFARGDMDLLLSSPLAPQSVIAVRAATIAASVTLEFAALILPFVNVFVLFGLFAWLKVYVLLPALGLLATTISLLLALMFLWLFGPRRTRVIAQVMSALIAMGFMLLGQLPNLMSNSAGGAVASKTRVLAGVTQSLDSALWMPALAVMNGFVPTVLIAVGCVVIFALTTRQLGDSFIRASIASTGMSVGKRTKNPATTLQFRSSTRLILIRKELRLIARDPWMLTQLLQQSIYVIPFGIMSWRNTNAGLPIVWGMTIIVAGNTASALAWLTVAAEDVPELVAAAPISPRAIIRIKLETALLPVLPITMLPMLILWRTHLWFGMSVTLCALGSAVSCALLNVHDQPPGKRLDFRQRYKGNAGRGFVELLIVGLWALTCFLMVWLSPWR